MRAIILSLAVLLLSCDVKYKRVDLSGFSILVDKSPTAEKSGADFSTGKCKYRGRELYFYSGQHPHFLRGMDLYLRVSPSQYSIPLEKESKLNCPRFISEIKEETDSSVQRRTRFVEKYGLSAKWPKIPYENYYFYHLKRDDFSAWLAIPVETGTGEIVLHDSTMEYQFSLKTGLSLRFSCLCIYPQKVSLKDTNEIFNFVRQIM